MVNDCHNYDRVMIMIDSYLKEYDDDDDENP